LAGKKVSEMTYFMWTGMLDVNSVNHGMDELKARLPSLDVIDGVTV